MFPGAIGGTNWGGTASDPKARLRFHVHQRIRQHRLDREAAGRLAGPLPAGQHPGQSFQLEVLGAERWTRTAALMGASSWPCQKPPWGRLTAVNANTGEFAWQIPLGVTDELPEGKQNTGRIGFGGPIVTAGGLVFIGATNDKTLPRLRFEDRQGAVGHQARLQRHFGADHVSGQERQAVRRGGGRGWRRGCRRSRDDEQTGAAGVRSAVTPPFEWTMWRRGGLCKELKSVWDRPSPFVVCRVGGEGQARVE